MFSVEAHISDRNRRHSKANIYSKDFPGLATIELNISELCNRTCSFCPRHDPKVYPNQKLFMHLSLVDKLVSEIEASDWWGDVHITGFGEPHTHASLLEIVQILKRSDKLFVEITTNGDRIIDKEPELAMDLWGAGLDMLTIDCYDGDIQYNSRYSILQALNERDNWRLRNHYDSGNASELMEEYGFNNRSGILGGDGIQGQCFLPFYKAFIDWNGDMLLCCNDWHRKSGTMGNIYDQSFSQCWNSDRMQSIRRSLGHGRRKLGCANCNINGTKFGRPSYELYEKNINTTNSS